MRHFKLVNNSGELLDITTKEILFHEISGLGFEEDNDFRKIGDIWWLNNSSNNQSTISGKMLFTEFGTEREEPYSKYQFFARFISKAPLTILYNPFGPIEETDNGEWGPNTYCRRVRVSKLEKTEKTLTGVLDSAIDFVCYTPWYRFTKLAIVDNGDSEDTSAWIWGDGDTNPPLIFEPTEQQTARRAKFRYEPKRNLVISLESSVKSPAKLIIHGPITSPIWRHVVTDLNGNVVYTGLGAFTSNVELQDGDRLEIDNTDGEYSIIRYLENGTIQDLYPSRNFSYPCFITLREGINSISVTSSQGEPAKSIELEGHLYYATV